MIELPDIPELPEHPAGHEISPQKAQALIESVSQREWGIDWTEFRMRWNRSMGVPKDQIPDHLADEDLGERFTSEETDQLRPLARLLVFAVLPPGFAD